MRTWSRVEPANLLRTVAGVFFVVGLAFFLPMRLLAFFGPGQWSVNPGLFNLVDLLFAACWLTFAFRMHRAGIYAGPAGLRVRSLLRTETVPWSAVTGFEVKPGRRFGFRIPRDAIWVLGAGKNRETCVQRSTGFDLLSGSYNIGPLLNQADFDLTLTRLRDLLGEHLPA
ncbi:PH domain-containing protein [Longispora sp. K20-0274]|uniref:PH domain-containing protein n=1 Tax=Longispora sp. K20-0274 TaxID=3088255 RepID=UPI00399A8CE1